MEASASDEVGGEPQIAEDGCARSRRRERLLVQDVCADAAVHRVLDFRIRLCRRIRGCKLHPKRHLKRQRCVAHTPMARPRTLCCALNPPSASPTGNTIGCLAAAAGAGRCATAGPVCSCGSASRSTYTKHRPAGWRGRWAGRTQRDTSVGTAPVARRKCSARQRCPPTSAHRLHRQRRSRWECP